MKQSARITQIVVLALILAAVIYDVGVYSLAGVDATISRVVLSWAQDIPIILLPIGVVLGHLFWPQRARDE